MGAVTGHEQLRQRPRFARSVLVRFGTMRYSVLLLSALLVLVAYLPLAFFRFAFADDYALMMIHGYRAVNPFWIGDGRVLGGLICAGLFSLFDRVSEAPMLRLIGLLELFVCVLIVQDALVLIGFDVGWAALTALLWASSPTIQNWVVWGVSSWQLPALILGLAAFYPWQRIVGHEGRPSPVNIAIFIALQLLAMLIYQPFAVAAWPLIALALMTNLQKRSQTQVILASLCAFVGVLVLSIAITEILIWLVIPYGAHDRIAIATLRDIPDKLAWLFSHLAFVLSFVGPEAAKSIYLPTAFAIAVGLAIRAQSLRQYLLRCGLFFGACGAATLPSLLSAEDTPICTDVVLALTASAFLAFALREILVSITRESRHAVPFLAAFVLLALLRSAHDVLQYNAEPQQRELSAIEARLSQERFPQHRAVVLIGLPQSTSLEDQRYCLIVIIGCASSSFRFALPNMVRLWLRDNNRDLKTNALFFALGRADEEVFSFEPDRSTWSPMPSDPLFIDVRPQLGK